MSGPYSQDATRQLHATLARIQATDARVNAFTAVLAERALAKAAAVDGSVANDDVGGAERGQLMANGGGGGTSTSDNDVEHIVSWPDRPGLRSPFPSGWRGPDLRALQ